MQFTVAVCTYNRAYSLARTLASFDRLNGPLPTWELLLIDNNSTDATRAVAGRFQGNLPMRYVFEPQQGLSFARMRAMKEARGQWLLFTDDDVEVVPNWLRAYDVALSGKTAYDYCGGPVEPRFPKGRPRWLSDMSLDLICGALVYVDLGGQNRDYNMEDALPVGANFGLRRAAFTDSSRTFRTDLGPKAGDYGRGDDSEFLGGIRREGRRGLYVAGARCLHWTDPKRLTLVGLYRYGVESGRAHGRMYPAVNFKRKRFRRALLLVRGIYQVLKGRGDRFRQCVIMVGVENGMQDVQSSMRRPSPRAK